MRILYRIAGLFCLSLSIFGIFLPLLPTTPLLLASLFFFSRSSEKMAKFIRTNRVLSAYVEPYLFNKPIEFSVKLRTLMILWGTLFLSSIVIGQQSWVNYILFAVGVGVTMHILSLRSVSGKSNQSGS